MMDECAQNLVRTIAEKGPRQFAAWKASLFAAYVERFDALFQQTPTSNPG